MNSATTRDPERAPDCNGKVTLGMQQEPLGSGGILRGLGRVIHNVHVLTHSDAVPDCMSEEFALIDKLPTNTM